MHDRELRRMIAGINGLMPGTTDVQVLASATGASYSYWRDRIGGARLHSDVLDAYDALTSGQPDALLVSPDSHSLAAALVLSKSNNQIVGMAPNGLGLNKRARFGMSTAFTPMITVSGSANLIKNLYTMHGTAAADYIGWLISGSRNKFDGCHFGGPMNAAQGGHASYEGVAIDGSENVFEDCVFGTDTIGRDEVTPNVTLGAGTLTTFINCQFLCSLTDGDPVFVKAENTSGYTWARFKGCSFMAFNSNYATAMTNAFEMTGAASCAMVIEPDCTFQNVDLLADTTDDTFIWLPRTFSTTTDNEANVNVQLDAS